MLKDFKRIFHIAAWNRNIGDWTMGYNTHRMLERAAASRGIGLSFYMIDSQRSEFHDALIEQINDEASLFLIGGGGMVFNRPQDESASGWAFNIPEAKLASITAPMFVFAIGYNKFYFDEAKWPDYMGEHLRTLQDLATYFSVRDVGSKVQLVSKFGLDEEGIEVVPDPGMRQFDRHIEIPEIAKAGDGPLIGINWAGDRPEERFAHPWRETRRYFVRELTKCVRRLIEEKNARVLFIPHLEDVDVDFFRELREEIASSNLFSLYNLMGHLYPPAGEILYHHIPFFTNVYRQLDLTIGMRGHSCIFSFGAGTKFIPFGSHKKVGYFMEEIGGPDYSIKMIDPGREDAGTMYDTIVACLGDERYARLIDDERQAQFDRLDAVSNKMLDCLR